MSPALFVDAAFVLILFAVAGAIVLAARSAARSLSGGPSPRAAALGAFGFVLVIGAVEAAAAKSGWTTRWHELPPRIPGLALGTLITSALVLRFTRAHALLPGLPGAGLIAFHMFRFPLELVLFALANDGRLPERMTFAGRNFDVLVGLSAPFVAGALARGIIGWRTVIAWNLASLALLVNVTSLAIRSAPGPLHGFPGTEPLTLVANLPYTFLPGLLVPVAYLAHFLSLRWALVQGTREKAEHDVPARSPAP